MPMQSSELFNVAQMPQEQQQLPVLPPQRSESVESRAESQRSAVSSQSSDTFTVLSISAQQPPITIALCDETLWKQFDERTNEMIVTKAGRKMFPKMQIVAKGLEPHAHYAFAIYMKVVGCSRYKFANGEWTSAGPADIRDASNRITHQDHAQTGDFWLKNPICFENLKLTNKPKVEGGSEMSLCSMHRYQPVVQLIRYTNEGPRIEATFEPECTQFIAVTAYQNHKIIELKVRHNPYAKGFREGSARKRKCLSPEDNATMAKRTSFEFLNNASSFADPHFWEAYYNAFNAFNMQNGSAQGPFPWMQPVVPGTAQQVQPSPMPPFPYSWCWPMLANSSSSSQSAENNAQGKPQQQF